MNVIILKSDKILLVEKYSDTRIQQAGALHEKTNLFGNLPQKIYSRHHYILRRPKMHISAHTPSQQAKL
jgi:hypothetical protein